MLSNDAKLFNLIAGGDENAFAEIYENYTPSIRSHVRRIVRDPSPVQDIAQEAFVQLWIKREQLPRIERALQNNNVKYIMVGGYATNLHGYSDTPQRTKFNVK